jgi:type IV pilus assembly protein PilX
MNHSTQQSVRNNLPDRQRGAILVISMLILLVMTIIGVTGSRTTVLEERMAGNMRDKELSFQSAEAALRAGEQWVAPQAMAPNPVASCSTAPCNLWEYNVSAITDIEDKTLSWWQTNGIEYGTSGSKEISGAAHDPRYLLEEYYESPTSLVLGKGKTKSVRKVYRVTAVGVGGTETTQTVLQSMYAKEYFGH